MAAIVEESAAKKKVAKKATADDRGIVYSACKLSVHFVSLHTHSLTNFAPFLRLLALSFSRLLQHTASVE